MTGEIKSILIKCLQDFVAAFQEKRKKVTDQDVKHFMSVRKIEPFPKKWLQEKAEQAAALAKAKEEEELAKKQ